MENYKNIMVDSRDKVGLITLHRPDAMNALNADLLSELVLALKSFDRDENIGAVVVTGSQKVFAAGADIKSMVNASAVDMLTGSFVELFDDISQIKKPLIAAVAGYALGGGFELAMACDMVLAAENAHFGQPEVTIGVIPGAGGTQRLTHAVGKAIAMEMVLNNRTLTANEALSFGIVNNIFPVDLYLEESLKFASDIASRAPLAVRLGKEAVNLAFELPLQDGLKAERQAFYFLFATEDQKEGMKAFVEKRKPNWKGK